jgi:trehalose 6-phosphate phosphatase
MEMLQPPQAAAIPTAPASTVAASRLPMGRRYPGATPLPSPGVEEMSRLVAQLKVHPSRTALLLDFDGTLAPIVDDPAAAVPLPGVADALAGLHQRYGRVAIVSGRPIAHLRRHLPAGPHLVGLYGLETEVDGRVQHHPEAEPWRRVIEDLADEAADELPEGVGVEDKGLSLTLHVRTHPERAGAVEAWAAAASARTGLVLGRARMSVELHPPIVADKGTAVDGLVAGFEVACFIGDDVGDLPAFDALDRFGRTGGQALRIVVESAETDPALLARADAVLPGPTAVLRLFESLLV